MTPQSPPILQFWVQSFASHLKELQMLPLGHPCKQLLTEEVQTMECMCCYCIPVRNAQTVTTVHTGLSTVVDRSHTDCTGHYLALYRIRFCCLLTRQRSQ